MGALSSENISVNQGKTEGEEIWDIIRTWLGMIRLLVFFAIILVAELGYEYTMGGLSMGLWALLIGLPLFVLLSVLILIGDKKLAPDKDLLRIEKSAKLSEKMEG